MNKSSMLTVSILIISFVFGITLPTTLSAATSAPLGVATTYSILGSTYTNTTAGTTVNGDLGYTTPPAVMPTVNGATHVADASYNQAGIDQSTALGILNAQICNFSFGSAQDLSLLSQPLTPGVYCITGAMSVGTGGITLTSAGTYIFRSTGALNTVANSVVTLSPGVSACDIFWTPTATTLGANSTFVGTDIDASGITIGSTVSWTGRALAFGATVTTDNDTITAPTCTTPTPTPTTTPPIILGEIHGIKFEDWDGDKSAYENPWESKLSGWTIYLDTNNNNVLDLGETATTTNSYGAYSFLSLPAGIYHLREVQKPGWIGITPLNSKYDIMLLAGQIVKNKDFGNFKLGSISGMKFNDLNANSKKGPKEPGLAGWVITLRGPNNTTVSTTTDANGDYSFQNLGPGKYTITEAMKSGWKQTVHPGPIRINSNSQIGKKNFGNTQAIRKGYSKDRNDEYQADCPQD